MSHSPRRAGLGLSLVLLGVTVAAVAQAPVVDPYLGIPEGGGPIDEGPVPDGIESVSARACGECHADAYRQWRRSRHRTSYTNATFRAEFEPARRPYCARCHAPLTDDPLREPELAAEGIDCAACHVRAGAVLNPTVSGRAPHRSLAVPEIAQPLACARCHNFAPEQSSDELLQATHDEWARSDPGRAGTSCQDCHMPRRGRAHRHDFPGARDAALMRDALRVTGEATTSGDTTRVTLEIRAGDVGHSVPTGDVFRWLEVRAWVAGRPEATARRALRRRFRASRREWRPGVDDRVPPPGGGARTVELEIPGAGRAVRYTVDLWLVAERHAGGADRDPLRRRVASGRLRVGVRETD